MDNRSFAVIRYEYSGNAAKIFVHMNVGIDPWLLLHIHTCFHICILAVSHHTNKYVGFDDFSCIRIDDRCRIPCPVYFNLFAGFAVDMHGSASFLLILLDVIAELGIHERFLTIRTAVLHVFCPQKLFTDSIAEQLLMDVIVVRHTLVRWYPVLLREHEPLKFCVGHCFIKRPWKF